MEANKQRTFDIEEYKAKIIAALEKLQATQKPGEGSGKGGKADVLRAAVKEIKAVLAKGYTPKQVAAAIQSDVFGILPKTITEIIASDGVKQASKQTRKQATKQSTEQKAGTQTNIPLAGFAIDADKDDL